MVPGGEFGRGGVGGGSGGVRRGEGGLISPKYNLRRGNYVLSPSAVREVTRTPSLLH